MRYTLTLTLILLVALAPGCASWFTYETPVNPDKYHVGNHGWDHDSLYFRVFRTSEPSADPSLPKITVECRSCNLVQDPLKPDFDRLGKARLYIPEARNLIGVRLHVKGSGIDTTFIQKQPSPEIATSVYHLSTPLTGRILVTQLALLYSDTTMGTSPATAQTGDELNIFGERPGFYLVHHPLFHDPLLLLKDDAVRIN